jgi:hypothetical protein
MRFRAALVVSVLLLLLASGLVALLAQLRRSLHGPRRSPERPGPAEPVATDAFPAASRARPPQPAPPPVRRAGRTGVAHLRGRVVFPPLPPADKTRRLLRVTASDGRRTLVANVERDSDRFALHVPAGHYVVMAHAGDLVGLDADVTAVADAERDVTIPLEHGAEITGRVHGVPDGADVAVIAYIAGTEIDAYMEPTFDAEAGTFSADGLRAGQRYDLSFSGPRVRTTRVAGVVAPAEGLDVTVAPLAVLRGAFGFPRGGACPITSISLVDAATGAREPGGDEIGGDSTTDDIGRDCRFQRPVPAGATAVRVTAEGAGWHVEEEIAVPPFGDPDPICLNPPCRAEPLEGTARLHVTWEGQDGPGWIGAHAGSVYCRNEEAASCDLDGLPIGQPIGLMAFGGDCSEESRIVTLASGDNFARLACRRRRKIQGVVVAPTGGAPQDLAIQCQGGDPVELGRTLVFSVDCPDDVSSLEYRLISDGSWTSIAIPPNVNPAFIQIALER